MIEQSKKNKAVTLFLRGLKYDEIHARLSISVGEVSNIVNEYRRANPEYEQLQQLAEKLPADMDYAQYNQLFDSLTQLQKQLDCPVEQVPSLVQDKIVLVNEIEALEEKRKTVIKEISDYEQTKQDIRFDIQMEQGRKNQIIQDIRVAEFKKGELQRDLVVLQDALTRGNKWLQS